MGANASALVNPAKKGHVSDSNVREQLEVLLKLADARLDAYQSELESMFVDNASQYSIRLPVELRLTSASGAAKCSVPGKRALRFARYVGVNIGQVKEETTEVAPVVQAGQEAPKSPPPVRMFFRSSSTTASQQKRADIHW